MPRVSIITAAKIDNDNGLEWLREMIESIKLQSFQEWELLIVNDHSKTSWRPLGALFANDERIRGIKANHEHASVSRARNQAVGAATAKLILPVDADDRLKPNALKRFLTAWDQKGHQKGIVYSDVLMFDDDTSRYYKSMPYSFNALLKNTFMIVGCLHTKNSWDRIGGWKSELDSGLEDWEYWIRAGELGICGFHLPEPLYEYRRHSNGRIAKLQSNANLWNISYQKVRSMHQETYNGRRPMGCCGGSGPLPAHKPANQAQARQDIINDRAPVQNAVKMVYIGSRRGSFGMKGLTGRRYRIPGKGQVFTVEAADASFLGKFNNGRDFVKARMGAGGAVQ